MAQNVAVGDILSVRAWSVLNDQAAVNTYNFECVTNTGGGVTDQAMADAIAPALAAFYKANMPSAATYRGIQVYFLKRGTGLALPPAVISAIDAGVGTGTGFVTPTVAAAIISYRCSFRGPHGRGRVYIPFIASEYIDIDGRPSTAYVVLLNSLASFLLTPLVVTVGGATGTFVWSLIQKHKGAEATVTGHIVSGESADKIGQMHKRGDYGRPNGSPI